MVNNEYFCKKEKCKLNNRKRKLTWARRIFRGGRVKDVIPRHEPLRWVIPLRALALIAKVAINSLSYPLSYSLYSLNMQLKILRGEGWIVLASRVQSSDIYRILSLLGQILNTRQITMTIQVYFKGRLSSTKSMILPLPSDLSVFATHPSVRPSYRLL